MDEPHLRKIDLADEIFVVNATVDDQPYIGESTAREIAYAKKHGKRVRYFADEFSIRTEVYEKLLAGVEREKKTQDDDALGIGDEPRDARRGEPLDDEAQSDD